mmetsp:Transcript_20938/g.45240  ORF Transcript_20938/g.45240 Transcript_20938/m.45240 type:complete len:129 (-) Transcript_20938:76-462(-)
MPPYLLILPSYCRRARGGSALEATGRSRTGKAIDFINPGAFFKKLPPSGGSASQPFPESEVSGIHPTLIQGAKRTTCLEVSGRPDPDSEILGNSWALFEILGFFFRKSWGILEDALPKDSPEPECLFL